MTKLPAKRITIDLPMFQIKGLEAAAKEVPHETEEELLRVIFSRGLLSILGDGALAETGTRYPPLDASGTANPYPKKRRPATDPHSHQRVESYVATNLPESLRSRLEEFLITHKLSDQEDALRRLLETALDHVERRLATLEEDPSQAFEELKEINAPLTPAQKMAWKKVCAMGRRGWR